MKNITIDLGYQSICSINNSGWDQNDEFNRERKLSESEVVIPATSIKIVIDYPVEYKATYEHESKNGFTRKHLAELIAKDYQEMYDEEEATTVIVPTNIPGMLNRCETNGKYGIWGHNIDDLILHTAKYDPKSGEVVCVCDS